MATFERLYNDKGELAVLYSSGFGAGWSTDDYEVSGRGEEAYRLALDSRIIKFWLENEPSESEMHDFLKSIGYKDIYMGGYEDLRLAWIPKGTTFYIHEYDGSESIKTPENCNMIVA